jgi:hypothetical protein
MRILFCNLQLLPCGVSGGNCLRASFVASALLATEAEADVIVLCEIFGKACPEARMITADLRAAGYTSFSSDFTDSHHFATHGGLLIASRTPLTEVTNHRFTIASSVDRLAHKGYLKTRVLGCNLCVTHMQAGNNHTLSALQFSELMRGTLPEDTVFVGDFNWDLTGAREWLRDAYGLQVLHDPRVFGESTNPLLLRAGYACGAYPLYRQVRPDDQRPLVPRTDLMLLPASWKGSCVRVFDLLATMQLQFSLYGPHARPPLVTTRHLTDHQALVFECAPPSASE